MRATDARTQTTARREAPATEELTHGPSLFY